MTNYEIPLTPNAYYYTKSNTDYINMHEVHVSYNHGYNLYLVIGFTGGYGDIYFALVNWRNDWYNVMHPDINPILQKNLNVIATNASGTMAFNRGGIYFTVIPVMF